MPLWPMRTRPSASGASGKLERTRADVKVEQPSSGSSLGDVINKWTMQVNDHVPWDIVTHLGAGEADLELGSAMLRRIEVHMGVGQLTLDLRGTPKRSSRRRRTLAPLTSRSIDRERSTSLTVSRSTAAWCCGSPGRTATPARTAPNFIFTAAWRWSPPSPKRCWPRAFAWPSPATATDLAEGLLEPRVLPGIRFESPTATRSSPGGSTASADAHPGG